MPDVYAPEVGQSPAELRQAVALYRKSGARRVLEIGVYYGGSLNAWLAEEPALVVAVDPEFRGLDFRENVKPDTELIEINGRSQDLDVMDQIREHGPYDWVFIDGDHQYEAVASDARLALSVISTGGHILFHDIVPPPGEPTTPPGKVWTDLSRDFASFSFVEPRPPGYPPESANGIGVISI